MIATFGFSSIVKIFNIIFQKKMESIDADLKLFSYKTMFLAVYKRQFIIKL